MTTASNPVFIEAIHARSTSGVWYELALIVAGSLLIAATAQIAIPLGFSPVPITGQTFGILLIGALYGARRGALTVMLYLVEGAAALPVFAAFGAGATHLLGPTGGYLIGFVPAAFLVGVLAQRGWDRWFLTTVAAMVAGNLVIFIVGATWLTAFIDADLAITLGVVPFLPGAVVKIVLAALLLPAGWRLLDGRILARARDRHRDATPG